MFRCNLWLKFSKRTKYLIYIDNIAFIQEDFPKDWREKRLGPKISEKN